MLTEKFARKPFLVEAVQVTHANMDDVAKWCGGSIKTEKRGSRTVKYVEVPVTRPLNERQKKALVGDYVLSAGRSFKSYGPKAFDDCFEKPSEGLLVTAAELLQRHETEELLLKQEPLPNLDLLAEKYAPGKV